MSLLNLTEQTPAVQQAERQFALAERQRAVAGSPVSLEFSTGYSRVLSSDIASSNIDPLTLTAAFNLFPLGPRFDTLEGAEFDLIRARRALEDARAEALIDAVSGYLTALRAGQEVQVEQSNVAVRALELEATRTRLGVGAATETDVLRAELELSQAESDLAEAERVQVGALAELSLTLGVEVTAVAGAAPVGQTPTLDNIDTRLVARSDVLDAQLAVAEAERAEAGTLRDNLPSGSLSLGYLSVEGSRRFQLGASYSTTGPGAFQPALSASYDPDVAQTAQPIDLAQTPTLSGQGVSVGLSLSIPLDVALSATLDAASLGVENARAQLLQTLDLARLEVASRGRELAAAESSLALSERFLAQSEEAVAATRQRFDAGVAAILDLRRVEQSRTEARLTRARAQDAVLLARLQLARSLALDPRGVL